MQQDETQEGNSEIIHDKQSLFEMDYDQWVSWCENLQAESYRAKQICQAIYQQRVTHFDDLKLLPKPLREALKARFQFWKTQTIAHHVAQDRTEKLLLQLRDQQVVECVLMRETSRRTICISTQIGCAMGCRFCASGMLGLKRNLTSAEILEQILQLNNLLRPNEKVNRITNLVVMGIGEPLANLDALLPALEMLHHEQIWNFSPRRITISTVGLPEQMRKLAAYNKPYNLAISLHAPNDQLRTELIPVNGNIGLAEIMEAG